MSLVNLFFVAEGEPVEQGQLLAFLVLDYLQLLGNVGPVEGYRGGLA